MSSSGDIAISVRDVSKSYIISHNQEAHVTLAEAMLHRLRHPFQRPRSEKFWALQDINFDVSFGEVVGIVGRNGAGKSTLLKILSRITEPATGQIDLYGRIGSLLEVGTGFHPELTGRENIFLNGHILGMNRAEIRRQFDAIVEFAGVDKFLDTPVKRYSSGMFVRLAFSVAAHLNPEILVVDEVLAVGDAEFQRKCLGKMRDVASGGRTVLFVSHNMAAVRQLCTSGILLDGGRIVKHGTVSEVVQDYLAARATGRSIGQVNRHGMELAEIALRDADSGYPTQSPIMDGDYQLYLKVIAHRPLRGAAPVIRIYDDLGTLVSSICCVEEGMGTVDMDGPLAVSFNLPRLQLYPGRYSVTVCLYALHDPVQYLEAADALTFDVQPAPVRDASKAYDHQAGKVRIANGGEFLDAAEIESDDVVELPTARSH
ncbi:MAG: polysaccharide ABC transporter ATP-binding protein [Tepidisphaeraceae bacterium]|jgi:lipopolysaccharide transport system ATP-binding protein